MTVTYIVNSVHLGNNNGTENADKTKEDEIHRRTELDTQRALDETGFGKFNYKVVAVSGLICTNVAFTLTTIGFVLPSAACDFNMNTIDKSHLSTSPIFGMVFGACIWGCIADTKGRRTALLNCLYLQALVEVLTAIVSNYWGFLILKFTSGFALSGQMAILYTYLGEFQPTKYRERTLSIMEIPWVTGVILTPLLAWLIIPLNIEFTTSSYSFKSWNLFVVISALPAFLVGCGLMWLPETPKYLAACGRHSDLRNVLTAMYRENTGNSSEEYVAKMDSADIMFFTNLSGSIAGGNPDTIYQTSTMGNFREFFSTLYRQTRMLIKPPYLTRTLITSLDSYCIFSSLYTLMLWFPELFQRFADFEEKYPGVGTSICIVSQSEFQPVPSNQTITTSSLLTEQAGVFNRSMVMECKSTIETQVYIHTLMLGLACVPVAIIFPLCINRLGFRFYLVFSTFSCCAVTIGMIFVTNSSQNLILSCIFEALISLCATVIFCLVVELFPTHLRVSASVISALFSRIGALVGNTIFGYLIDGHCYLLICIITAELFVAGTLGLLIPKAGLLEPKAGQQLKVDVPGIGSQFKSEKYSPSQETAT